MGSIRRAYLLFGAFGVLAVAGCAGLVGATPSAVARTATPLIQSGPPECTNNTSTQSGATITARGNMTGCQQANLSIERTVINVTTGATVEEQGPKTCTNSRTCAKLSDYTFSPPDGTYKVTIQGCSSLYNECDSKSISFIVDTGCCIATQSIRSDSINRQGEAARRQRKASLLRR